MDSLTKKTYSGALVLGFAAFIAKFLGAFYRIPLTKIIGGTGLGLYQMVFPVYTLLLDFSGAGVPNAVAKMVSSYKGTGRDDYARRVLKTCLVFFSLLGALFSLLTALFSKNIAAAQGNEGARLAYLFLSRSVFLVCLICCFRGYFQGFMDMKHTAISQIIEQTVKLGAGLYLASRFLPDTEKAVAGATAAITISEFIALAVLVITYLIKSKKRKYQKLFFDAKTFSLTLKEIISLALPIALTGMVLPLSKVADSFLVINALSIHSENATLLFGLFSGVATTVIGLPVAVCYGISAVSVPLMAKAEKGGKNKRAARVILLTLAASVPCAALCFFFAPFIIKVLFGYLSESDRAVSINLLKLCSPCVVLLSVLQTLNGILIGKGKAKTPLIGLSFGVAVKIIIEVFTLKTPEIGIYGAAIASIACYFTANLINLSMVFPFKPARKTNESLPLKGGQYADL